MTHNTLENYYKSIFSLTYHHKWPMDIESLIPYERDIYIRMIMEHLDHVKVQQQEENNRRKLQGR